MSTTRLAQLFREQTSLKIRLFDASIRHFPVQIIGFKDKPLSNVDVIDVIEGLKNLSHGIKLEVDLSGTQLSEEAIKKIAEWVKSSNTPKHLTLKLQNLTFSDDAIKALVNAAISPKAPANLEVVLDGAHLTEEGIVSLREILFKIAEEKNGKNVKFSIAPSLLEVHQGEQVAQVAAEAHTSPKLGR